MPGKEKLSAAGDKDDLGRGLPATAAGGWSAGPAGLGRTGARRPQPPSKPHPPPPPAGAGAEAGGVEEVDPAGADSLLEMGRWGLAGGGDGEKGLRRSPPRVRGLHYWGWRRGLVWGLGRRGVWSGGVRCVAWGCAGLGG